MMTLWVSLSFFTFPSVSLADLLCPVFLWFCNLFFIPSDLVLHFLLVLRLTLLCRVFFWHFSWGSFFRLILGVVASLSLWFPFARVKLTGFRFLLFAFIMGPGRFTSLLIGDGSSAIANTRRIRGASDRPAVVVRRDALGAPPLPLDKGKGRINLIEYPEGSDYLKSAVQHAVTVGPSKVGPSYGSTFAKRYRPPLGVRVWSPNVLTFYVVPMPRMVCFFEVAFDNGLRFPLHPFIKGVLQHFNVYSSQLAPNGWGILVGLLALFRDRGLGVPSIALILYLFSPKETAEDFLYFSRRAGAPLVISDLPSSHRSWKGRYFFVRGRN